MSTASSSRRPSPEPAAKSSVRPTKAALRKQRRRRQMADARKKEEVTKSPGSVIDLTKDDDDIVMDPTTPSFYEGIVDENGAGPSRRRRKEPKGTEPSTRATILSDATVQRERTEAQAGQAEPYQPESFRPLSRSILPTGWRLSPSASPPPNEQSKRYSPSQVNLIIDEKPSGEVGTSGGHGDVDGAGEHFEPPGLFTTSLLPSKRTKRTLRKQEKQQQEEAAAATGGKGDKEEGETDDEVKSPEESLLLPAHVVIEGQDEEDGAREIVQDQEGVHIFDDSQAKGVTRYFDPQAGSDDTSTFLATADQSRICMNCKRPGHNQRDCPHVICPTCGKEDEHERRDCPYNLICFRCGLAGHKIQDCSKPRTKGGACDKCGAYDHTGVVCPSLWRMYTYYTPQERKAVEQQRGSTTGWAKEAVGFEPHDRHCYNCARKDHWGDDCPRMRGSLARFAPSAFNKLTLSLGPFASNENHRPMPRATHQRFDDDDAYTASPRLPDQATPFGGLNAGKKTVEKRKRAAMEQERQFGGSEPRPSGRNRDRWDRGRDRDSDNETMPFGHRHFMTPSASGSPAGRDRLRNQKGSQQIQFGKLSMPGEGDTPRRDGAGATALVNRALRQSHNANNSPKSPTVNLNGRSSPLAGTPSSAPKAGRKRKPKQADPDLEEGEIEEIEFRKSGAGGGKVTDWGREMDEEERKAKRVAAAASGPATTSAGAGLSIKGRSKVAAAPGQKYHGGY